MQALLRVQGNVQWQLAQQPSGNWIAVCDPLKLTIQSEDFPDLMEDIQNTLDMLLKDLLSTGPNELNRFLADHGWKLITPIPVAANIEAVRFELPFFTAMMGARDAKTNVYQ